MNAYKRAGARDKIDSCGSFEINAFLKFPKNHKSRYSPKPLAVTKVIIFLNVMFLCLCLMLMFSVFPSD